MIISTLRRTTRRAVKAGIPANDHRVKTVLTEARPVELSVPRARDQMTGAPPETRSCMLCL
jgi:hypothetical protein